MDLILTRDEVIELTGKRTGPAQVRALRFMAIEHRVRSDGSVVVLREQLQPAGNSSKLIRPAEPRWNTD